MKSSTEAALTKQKASLSAGAKSAFIINWILFVLALAPILASFGMSTNGSLSSLSIGGVNLPFYSLCPFRIVTGFNCPFCGMTRSFIYISHLNFKAAWAMNPAGFAVYALFLFEAAVRGILILKNELLFSAFFKKAEKVAIIFCIISVSVQFFWQFIILLWH